MSAAVASTQPVIFPKADAKSKLTHGASSAVLGFAAAQCGYMLQLHIGRAQLRRVQQIAVELVVDI